MPIVDQSKLPPLYPKHLQAACTARNFPLTLRIQEGSDQSYHFISTFIGEHLAWHDRDELATKVCGRIRIGVSGLARSFARSSDATLGCAEPRLMTIRVHVVGAAGRMGSAACEAIEAEQDLVLTGRSDRDDNLKSCERKRFPSLPS